MDIETKEMGYHVSMPKRYIAATPFYHFGFSRDTVVGLSLTKTYIAAFDVTQRVVDHLYLIWVHKLKWKAWLNAWMRTHFTRERLSNKYTPSKFTLSSHINYFYITTKVFLFLMYMLKRTSKFISMHLFY